MERLTEKDRYSHDYKIQAKNLNSHCVAKDKKGYVTYYGQHVDKLAEYEDLEEKGLLLRLPIPIGTTVYKFEPLAKRTKRYIKTTITRYEVFNDSIWFTFANGLGRNIEDFGKYVFLTKDEAEQKLKEMEV